MKRSRQQVKQDLLTPLSGLSKSSYSTPRPLSLSAAPDSGVGLDDPLNSPISHLLTTFTSDVPDLDEIPVRKRPRRRLNYGNILEHSRASEGLNSPAKSQWSRDEVQPLPQQEGLNLSSQLQPVQFSSTHVMSPPCCSETPDLSTATDFHPALPTTTNSEHPDLQTITAATLETLLATSHPTIIDCRYPYEYSGGHVQSAINLYTPQQLEQLFFTEPEVPSSHPLPTGPIIFYCEFSSYRGPRMLRRLRSLDRKYQGEENYPRLTYPSLYLLQGGYRGFYLQHNVLCSPRHYVPMQDARHKHLLKSFRRECKESRRSTRTSRER